MDLRALGATEVLDIEGAPVELGSLWRERTAVIAWLRHFGCLFCREQVAEFRAARPAFADAGADLAFIGCGTARAAAWFQRRYAPDSTVLTDPELRSYDLIGASRGVIITVGPRAWRSGIRALRHGARQGATRGHPFQQGGVLVITAGERVVFSHISNAAGDHPRVDDVVAAATKAARVRARSH